jgi:molybdenum cofactor cytidylyltransferase
MGTAAMVLSGGESSRFGGAPKALLPIDERSAVRRVVELCLDGGFDPVEVVVGPHRGPIARELSGLAVDLVDAERWREGRTGSIQDGIEALPPEADILLWPIDHPFVGARTVDALLAARASDLLGVWFIPTFEGRGGHPILWRSSVRTAVLELRPDAPLRSLLPEFGPQVRRVPVDDPGVAHPVDTPEAYRAGLELWQRQGAF